MKNYERPMIIDFEDASEGIYAASGFMNAPENGTDPTDTRRCWTLSVSKDQADAGGCATFRLAGTHPAALHISTKTYLTVTFNNEISNVEFEGFTVVSVVGCTATLERPAHANAYTSGDQFNSLLKAYPVTGGDCKSLECVGSSISCEATANVQGGYDAPQ